MDTSQVLLEERTTRHGKRLVMATLNAPQSLNALTQGMIDVLQERLAVWRDDPQVACVVVQGAGDKALCAGGDIVTLYQSMRDHPGGPNPVAERFFSTEYRLNYTLHTYPKPILCWGHGIVMGGGLGVMAAASHRVVTERSRIAMPELGIGLFPDVGATWFLNRMPGRVGLYLGLTGTACNAADALFVGLGDYFITQAQSEAVLAALTEASWDDDPRRNRDTVSRLLREAARQCRDALPDSAVRAHLDFINDATDHTSVADIAAALQAAQEDDPWVARGAKALTQGSPTSVQVFFEQYRRGKYLSLREAFMLELILGVQCARHPDFAEGVRALLIDKDQQPQWTPPHLEQVTADWVEEHFTLPADYRTHPLADL